MSPLLQQCMFVCLLEQAGIGLKRLDDASTVLYCTVLVQTELFKNKMEHAVMLEQADDDTVEDNDDDYDNIHLSKFLENS